MGDDRAPRKDHLCPNAQQRCAWDPRLNAARGSRAMACGRYCDLRPAPDYSRLHSADTECDPLRCRPLHHVGLLVHSLDILCQSGRDNCSVILGHVCWYRSRRGLCVRRRTIARRRCGGGLGSMAMAAKGCGRRSQMTALGHVWTTPAVQEEFDVRLSVGCKSCVRPVCAAP